MQKLKGTKAGIPQKSKRLKNQSYTITSFQCTKKLEKNHRYSQEWTWMRRGIFLPIHFNSWSQVINTDQMLKFHKLKWIVILRGKKISRCWYYDDWWATKAKSTGLAYFIFYVLLSLQKLYIWTGNDTESIQITCNVIKQVLKDWFMIRISDWQFLFPPLLKHLFVYHLLK